MKTGPPKMVDQKQMSGECFYIQVWGPDYCKDCDYQDHDECGGWDILRTGKNSLGHKVPLKGKV